MVNFLLGEAMQTVSNNMLLLTTIDMLGDGTANTTFKRTPFLLNNGALNQRSVNVFTVGSDTCLVLTDAKVNNLNI